MTVIVSTVINFYQYKIFRIYIFINDDAYISKDKINYNHEMPSQ